MSYAYISACKKQVFDVFGVNAAVRNRVRLFEIVIYVGLIRVQTFGVACEAAAANKFYRFTVRKRRKEKKIPAPFCFIYA